MLDLDYFKSINDRFGHPTGDHVLTSFSSYLLHNLRAGDEVGRLGGEEFALLLPDISAGNVQQLITRLLDEFAHIPHHTPKDEPLYVTFSAGVAMLDDKCDLETWTRRADDALYVAKRGGRARVEAA
jgi:diguanylate cyclase (GGDEF)-like protein